MTSNGTFFLNAAVYGAGQLLAHHTAHRAADEIEIHGRHHKPFAFHYANGRADGIVQPSLLAGLLQAFDIRPRVREMERVVGKICSLNSSKCPSS
jgi:hypothetical protein